jgi:hypothetical protein
MAAQDMYSASEMKMTTDIPPQILTADTVQTRLGTLQFFDGFPDDSTVEKVFDNLDFQRGVQAFLATLPGAIGFALREGLRSAGVRDNQAVGITETLMDSKSLVFMPNCDSIYCFMWLDLRDGPLVFESPPHVLGFVNDIWCNYVGDVGNAGPDRGKGGRYLLLPPGYSGEVPEGYFVLRAVTFGNLLFWRGFQVDGDPYPAVEAIKRSAKVYLLAEAANPPPMKFINLSGQVYNTIYASDFSFFEQVNQVVQEEPNSAVNPDTLGLLAAIGITKGKPFAPDGRMRAILEEAAAVGNATARATLFRSRIKESYYYPDSAWFTPFVGGSYEFLQDGIRLLEVRTAFFYCAWGVTPAMAMEMVGVGSQYASVFVDSQGRPFDGSKTYKVHLPPNIPAKEFWSFVVYDNQTRSFLQTDQQFPSIGSHTEGIVINPDTSVDIWFGPTAPAGRESNWLQTIPGKSWYTSLRLYGPLEAWFDRSWRPGDIELLA